MIAKIVYTLRCDRCGLEASYQAHASGKARWDAARQGWSRPTEKRDWCPGCTAEEG